MLLDGSPFAADTGYIVVARWIAGGAIWLLALVLLPAPLAARIFLVVPLALVPHGICGLAAPLGEASVDVRRGLSWLALLAALPLVAAFALPAGTIAAALALPWLVLTAGLACVAIVHGLRALPSILGSERASELLSDAAFALLAIGATFALFDRAGFRPFCLDSTIVLITAVHFHVLGFGLMAVLAVLAARGSRPAVAAGYIFLLGIPLTAAGFTLGSSFVSWAGAIAVALGAPPVALALTRSAADLGPWRGIAVRLAAMALLVGIVLGLGWASAVQFGVPYLDFESMVRVHGALNAAGTIVAALALAGEHR
jgi:hypothetical protein